MSGSELWDTSAVVRVLRASRERPDAVLALAGKCISITVLGELLVGALIAEGDKERRRVELVRRVTTVLPHTALTAEYYAGIVGQLRADGRKIPTNDIWIAASAMEHGLLLRTHDAHFGRVQGLRFAAMESEGSSSAEV